MEEGIVSNTQLSVSIARLEERITGLSDDVHRVEASLDSFINGSNGRPGVIERITASELQAKSPRTEYPDDRMSNKIIAGLITISMALSTVLSTIINRH